MAVLLTKASFPIRSRYAAPSNSIEMICPAHPPSSIRSVSFRTCWRVRSFLYLHCLSPTNHTVSGRVSYVHELGHGHGCIQDHSHMAVHRFRCDERVFISEKLSDSLVNCRFIRTIALLLEHNRSASNLYIYRSLVHCSIILRSIPNVRR